MKKSYILAVVIAVVAVGWVLSGPLNERFSDNGPKPEHMPMASVAERHAEKAEDGEHLTSVRTMISSARPKTQEVVARGRTEAKRKVTLKSEVKGRVVEVVAEKGKRVKRGDVIVRIAINDRQAHLDEAKALVRQRSIEFQAADKLNKKGYRSETQLSAAQANLDAAKAAVKAMEVDIDKTVLRAPFDAVVEDRMVELGAYLDGGTAVATLVDEDPYLVIAQVSENDVSRLQTGHEGFALLATGETVKGNISFIATSAQPDTRTFLVELEVPNKDRRLRDGVTAELHFPVDTVAAHFVTPAILTLNDAGVIGVRCIEDEDVVRFHAVEIVGSDAQGVWIAGLPETVEIIVVGQEFVRDGDRVRRDTPAPAATANAS